MPGSQNGLQQFQNADLSLNAFTRATAFLQACGDRPMVRTAFTLPDLIHFHKNCRQPTLDDLKG